MTAAGGARSATGRRKPLGWLPWVLLLLLAIVIAVVVLTVANVGNDEDGAIATSPTPVAGPAAAAA